jgi:hypothetical protein
MKFDVVNFTKEAKSFHEERGYLSPSAGSRNVPLGHDKW